MLGHAVACRPQHGGCGGSGGSAKWGGGAWLSSRPPQRAPSPPLHQLGIGCPCHLPYVEGLHPVPEHPRWPMGLGRRQASGGLWPSALTHTHSSSSSCSPLSLGLSCSSKAPRALDSAYPLAERPGSCSERTAWELWAGVEAPGDLRAGPAGVGPGAIAQASARPRVLECPCVFIALMFSVLSVGPFQPKRYICFSGK